MFKKKKRKTEVTPEVMEEPVKKQKTIEPSTPIKERDNPASFFDFSTDEPIAKEVVEETKNNEEEVITVIVGAEPWKWSNTEEYELQQEKLSKKKKKRRRGKKEEEPIKEPIKEEPKEKKELSTFFEENKESSKKLKRSDKKALKKADKEKSSKKNRKTKKDKLQEDIKNQKIFRYNGKKYTKVEDFIVYLNEHYLDIEEIAEEVLEDENFFGWINKNSGVFAKSLKEYKEIKAKIENNS